MENFVSIYYWARIGILVFVSLFAILVAVRSTRTRAFSLARGVAVVALELIALVGAWLVTGASPSVVWLLVLLVVGAAIGFLAGKSARAQEGRLSRSPVGAWLSAVAFMFATMTLLFGTSYLFSIALLVLALAAGVLAGQLAGEMQAAKPTAASATT